MSGLLPNQLSPRLIVAQSLALVAPTAAPAMTIPAVYALVGDATWLAFAVAGLASLLIAGCVSLAGRRVASAGSLAAMTVEGRGRAAGRACAAALMLAYGTGAVAGIVFIAHFLTAAIGFTNNSVTVAALATCYTICCAGLALRPIASVNGVLLLIELAAVCICATLVWFALARAGSAIDTAQLQMLKAPPNLGAAVALALFGFVGFEGAASLGAEARRPLTAIPIAMMIAVAIPGLFFVATAYGLVAIYRGSAINLADPSGTAVLHLPALAGFPGGPGAIVLVLLATFAAGTAAFLGSLARLIVYLGRAQAIPGAIATVDGASGVPRSAVIAAAAAVLSLSIVLLMTGAEPLDLFTWLATASATAFLIAYAFTVWSVPVLVAHRTRWLLTVPSMGVLAWLLIRMLDPAQASPVPLIPIVVFVLVASGAAVLLRYDRNAVFKKSGSAGQ